MLTISNNKTKSTENVRNNLDPFTRFRDCKINKHMVMNTLKN